MAALKVDTVRDSAQRAAYWPLPLVRAIPAAALAITITFSANHSAAFGLTAFGTFAIVSGLAVALVAWRRLGDSGTRSYLVALAAITAASGILALLFREGGVAALFLVLTVFAALTGFLELYLGLRSRRRFVAASDWLVVGSITAVAAVVFVLIPPGYQQQFEGEQKVSGVLDSSIIAVGLLGAYAAIIAVYLLIAAFSAKWGPQSAVVPAESEKVA